LSARVERVAAEPQREHLEGQVRGGVGGRRSLAGLLVVPVLRDQVEDLGRRARQGLPRLLEVRLLDGLARGTRGQERPPQAQGERARAPLEGVERRGALAELARTQRDAARLRERGRDRGGEACG